MKKIIAVILAVIMIMSLATVAFAANSFTDISNSKNKEAIETLYELGVIDGYSKTKFGPKLTLSRAEACAVMVRALYGNKIVYWTNSFTDVPARAWYASYVDVAVYYDIMHGHNATTFAPDEDITYDQMATLVLNALGYNAPQLSGTWPENVERIANILGLYDNTSRFVFGSDTITREDACQMLYNALDCSVVEYVRGRIVETDQTLYEAMGFEYEPTPDPDPDPVPTPGPVKPVNPPVADTQIFGIVEFVETYTYGENHEYTGYEIKFYDNTTIYKTAGTKIVADGKLNEDKLTEAVEADLGRGDYVWLEKTYSNSDVYKIVAVIHFNVFQPDVGPDDNPVYPPVVDNSTDTGTDSTNTPIIPW